MVLSIDEHRVAKRRRGMELVGGVLEQLGAGRQTQAVRDADAIEHANQVRAHGILEGYSASDLVEQTRRAPTLKKQPAGIPERCHHLSSTRCEADDHDACGGSDTVQGRVEDLEAPFPTQEEVLSCDV